MLRSTCAAQSRGRWALSLTRAMLTALAMVGVVTPCAIARAQALPDLEAERFSPALGPASYFGVEATRTPGHLRYRLSLTTSYEANTTLGLRLDAGTYVADLDRAAAHLGGELGVGGRFAVGALLPAYALQDTQVIRTLSSTGTRHDATEAVAVGDVDLRARYRLLGVSASERDAPQDGPGVGLGVAATLPTQTRNGYAGEDSVRTQLSLLGDFELLGAGVAGNLGWRHRFDGVLRLHDEMTFGAALKLPLPPAPMVVTMLEFRGATDFRSKQATHLELDLGAKLVLGAFTISAAGGLGFGSGIGTPDGRVLLGLAFSPIDSDGDHDGVDDGADGCPFLAEDRDGFDDGDGCPDPDNDNDMIPDLDDLCPSVTAEEGRDEDEDGCTDGTKKK